MDIALVQIGAYQCEHDLVVTVDQVWPLPQVEDFTVSPTLPAAKASAKKKRKASTAVAALTESGAIVDGTELRIVPAGAHADAVTAWIAQEPTRGRAIWRTGEKVRALEWMADGEQYSTSGLAERIIFDATGVQSSVNGAELWALDDGTTLAELAGASTVTKKDWSLLHQLLGHLRPGEWTTYGDLASTVTSHPIAVGQHLTRCEICENAWRVLGSDGRPRPNFVWSSRTETRTCRQVLEDEGLTFTPSGNAEPAARVSGDQLKQRLSAS